MHKISVDSAFYLTEIGCVNLLNNEQHIYIILVIFAAEFKINVKDKPSIATLKVIQYLKYFLIFTTVQTLGMFHARLLSKLINCSSDWKLQAL